MSIAHENTTAAPAARLVAATLLQPDSSLRDRVIAGNATVGIIGMGYVGLPLARAFAMAGFPVLGFDVDETKITRLNGGESYFRHIPGSDVEQMRTRRFEATSRFDRLREADVVIVCVPTPLTESREPDLSFVVNSMQSVRQTLRRGQLIVLESTTYPGTTREVVLPILATAGLRVGEDYFLAYSPEREDPGNATYHTASIPKLVGGIDPASQELAVLLYKQVVADVIAVASPEIAEASKIFENTYRAVNIALVNELKILLSRMGIDVWEVIAAAKTKPFGFQAFHPGPGLGGHCIPIDPFYLSWVARKHGLSTRFIELAGEINTAMPRYVVDRITEALNDQSKSVRGSKILLLGVAYKKDVDDTRESPALELIDLLNYMGASVTFHDPHVTSIPKTRRHPALADTKRLEISPSSLGEQDCVVIVTDHSEYDWQDIVDHAPLIVDTRHATATCTGQKNKIYSA